MEAMDNTSQICKDNNTYYYNRNGGNLYGDGIRTGISKAKGESILLMDADGSHKIEDVLRLIDERKISNDDVIIGSRYIAGGNTDNNFILRFMSYVLNLTYRIVFKLNVKDVSNSFRIYDSHKLKNIKLECNNFDIVEEILIRLKLQYPTLKIKEIPISFEKRKHGESKRKLIKFIFSYLRTMRRLYMISIKGRRVDG